MSHQKLNLSYYGAGVIRLYGITQDPETKNYMMVLDYAKSGSLRNYLDTSYNKLNWDNKMFYLHYIAPETLRGQNYTKASDIYSFGIIMYELISGLPPYHDVSHDNNLAIKICQGLSPKFNIKVPQLIVHLIKRCLDANPLNRPTAKEIHNILYKWFMGYKDQTELQKQIKEAEEINNKSPTSNMPSTSLALSCETHSEAIHTSRLLNFNNLPE